ncbi:MAG: class II 3-deoxy-7-phosphoheptulonate synthase [Gaiellaceae bacterium]
MATTTWTPASWRELPAHQQPEWPDGAAAETVVAELRSQPPLVFAGEARRLREELARVAEGRAFVLQAGDCAESFHEHSAVAIREKLKVILQMSAVLTYAASLPTVKIGRMAGQFTKPRSSPIERVGDLELPSFRGHIVNSEELTPEARVPDPGRMLRGYHQASATLNLLRAFTKGGYADLAQVHAWNQEFVTGSPEGRRYEQIATEIERALAFMAACGVDMGNPALRQVDVWTCHEGLLLDFEEALTRKDSLTGDWYDCSAHLLWIGERTRQLDAAHVAFFSGVHNPIGVKLGPTATAEEALELCERLNPQRIPGRLTLITRLGMALVENVLPPLVAAVRDAGHPVVWVCDPMHGNTMITASGRKTRDFGHIMREIESFFSVHAEAGTWAGGVHLEITGGDVTECLGGGERLSEDELDEAYETLCDPRLNSRQALDLAFHIAELMRRAPRRHP